MAEIVSLNRARKKIGKQRERVSAGMNRLLHGRSKTERDLQIVRESKRQRDLDLHRIERGES